ncbi:MAG TPA: MFS transporter [Afifellaceae bacterium]|nr:MFS transporter [Afifellaceae bacterium]
MGNVNRCGIVAPSDKLLAQPADFDQSDSGDILRTSSGVVTNARHPIWLPAATRPGAWPFAILYSVESLSRASIASIIPIQAYDLLGDAQAVSMLYFAIGIAGVTATVAVPMLITRIARRRVYTIGALALISAAAALSTFTRAGQAIGRFLRVFAASALAITLNLYIMDFIRKRELISSESLRMTLSTFSWTLGPGFGVWLYMRFGIAAPYLWSAAWAAILIAIFWYFRLTDGNPIRPGTLKPATPLTNIRRFIVQPRLRLAWLIAFGRSCYWTTFYIYAPILMVVTGNGKLAGGMVVSAGNALLLSAFLWGRLGRRIGVRLVTVLSFLGLGLAALAAGISGEANPRAAAVFLLAGINFAVALDAVGSTPFLRAVHAYERPQMTAVYRTNLDMSDLLPPLIYSVILGFFGLGGVFVALAAFSLVCAWFCWCHLPRSM